MQIWRTYISALHLKLEVKLIFYSLIFTHPPPLVNISDPFKGFDLIDPTTNSWDEDLVRKMLWLVDAQCVLSIPLPQHNMSDFILTKNGMFIVWSAYFVEWDHQHGRKLRRTNGMGQTTLNTIWNNVWNLSCLAKVKIFI